MSKNILIGGAAGQGMDTLAAVLEKTLQRKGYEIFTIRDYMSRVRGGHNFIQIRFGTEELSSHWDELDGIISLNKETIDIHLKRLNVDGFIICDEEIQCEDNRAIRIPIKEASKRAGNPKTFGNVALGAFLKLYSIELSFAENVLNETFNGDIAIQNVNALKEGYSLTEEKYSPDTPDMSDKILINGNQSIALGALAAGCKFYSAYPMTPSTSIMNYLSSKIESAKIVVEQAEDEIAAINMAIGASYAGVRAMTGTSGGGFALKVEALGLSAMQEIPLVIAEIQRPGPVTGLPTRTEQSDLKFVISASQGEFPRMVIAVRNHEDAFYQTMRAFNLADKYRIPVIILGDQYHADYTNTVRPFDFEKVPIERHLNHEEFCGDKEYKTYEITGTGISPRIIPGKLPGKVVCVDSDEHDEYGHITESANVRVAMVDKRFKKLEGLRAELLEPELLGEEKPEVLLLAWGSLYGPVKEAVKLLNDGGSSKYGALVFGDIWPLPEKLLKEKAKTAKEIINVEQNATGQLASIIMEVTGIKCDSSILKYDGRPISSQEIYNNLKGGRG